jgi:signal transduction histidine kinase
VAIESSGAPREIRPPVCEDLFLIASEALRNALRHANASYVRVAIHFAPDQVELTVVDDGIGIAPEIQERGRDHHFGLQGMRERAQRHAGILQIKSLPGRGTEVVVSLEATRVYA